MQFSVLQWNVWVNEQPQNILQVLEKYQPDIICLQEVTQDFPNIGKDVPQFLATNLNYHVHHAVAHTWTDQVPPRTQGNCILSKLPLKNLRYQVIQEAEPKTANTQGLERRIACLCDVQLPDHEVTVVTTHLSFSDGFRETSEKNRESNLFLETLTPCTQKTIVTGDFNLTEHSSLVERLLRTYQNAGPSFDQKTWTTKPFSYHGFNAETLDWRLDYILATRDLEVVSTQILSIPFSDHLPILTVFKI